MKLVWSKYQTFQATFFLYVPIFLVVLERRTYPFKNLPIGFRETLQLRMAGVFPMDDEGLGDLVHNGHEIHSDDDCIEVDLSKTGLILQKYLLQVEESVYAKGPNFTALNQAIIGDGCNNFFRYFLQTFSTPPPQAPPASRPSSSTTKPSTSSPGLCGLRHN